MAFVDIPGGPILWGPAARLGVETNTTSFSTINMDAADEGPAAYFRAPKAGTIVGGGFRVSATPTGNPAPYNVGLVTLDGTTKLPTATGFAGSTVGTYDITAAGWVDVDFTDAGGTDVTVAKGDELCFRVWAPGTGVDGSNFAQIYSRSTAMLSTSTGPYLFEYQAAAWSRQTNFPLLSIKYSDGLRVPMLPFTGTGLTGGTIGSTVERGGVFTSPMPIRAVGLRAWVDPNAVTDAIAFNLYDAANTLLATAPIAANAWVNNAFAAFSGEFNNSPELAANTSYRLVLQTTTGTPRIGEFTVPTTGDKAAWNFPMATLWSATQRTGAGAWTDTTTVVPMLALEVAAIDVDFTIEETVIEEITNVIRVTID